MNPQALKHEFGDNIISMGDVPPENIVAMLDTAYEESFYGQTENEQAE